MMSDELNTDKSELDTAYIEEWIRKNFGSRKEGSGKDFEEEVAEARAKIEVFQNELVKKHANVFLTNMVSNINIVAVPVELAMAPYLQAMEQYLHKRNSASERINEAITTSLLKLFAPNVHSNTKPPVSEEKAARLYESFKSEDPEKIKQVGKELLLELLRSKPHLIEWYEKLYELTLCSSWTSYEVLSSDLWIDLVNTSLTAAKNVCKVSEDQTVESKEFNLMQFFRYDLNLRNKMGTLLEREFKFTNTKGINAAFDACFVGKGKKPEKEDRQENNKGSYEALTYIEQMRHLIMHNAGFVDEEFLKKTKADYKVGDRISLTGYELEKSMDAIFRKGFDLLEKTDRWLIASDAMEKAKKREDKD